MLLSLFIVDFFTFGTIHFHVVLTICWRDNLTLNFSFFFLVPKQRSTSLTSEGSNTQQLSPGGSNNPLYNNTMLTSSQISPPQRQPPSSLASPYSPLSTNHQQQSFSNLKWVTVHPPPIDYRRLNPSRINSSSGFFSFTGASNQQAVAQSQGARLSPSGLSPFQAQLSPRVSQVSCRDAETNRRRNEPPDVMKPSRLSFQPQTTFTGTSVMASGGQQSQMQQQNNWPSQQPQQPVVNNRISLQQQQNPMLDARLSVSKSDDECCCCRAIIEKRRYLDVDVFLERYCYTNVDDV